MDKPLSAGSLCATCTHWRGSAASYLGDCAHPETYFARVPFDYGCPLHQPGGVTPAQPGRTPQEPPRPASSGPIPVMGSLRKPAAAQQKAPGPRRLNP